MKMARWLSLSMLGLALFPRVAMPCGLCHEDDRSAVYSYEAVQKAKADPARLEFAVFKIIGPLPKSTVERLTQWLSSRPGVDPSTVKISATQKSMGLVWERARSKDAMLADLARDFPELKVHALVYEDQPDPYGRSPNSPQR
ncbi:MAG TPA: hypothetical protein VJR29_13825 [bacterium]|nr:hypothetical protein [bacterium]